MLGKSSALVPRYVILKLYTLPETELCQQRWTTKNCCRNTPYMRHVARAKVRHMRATFLGKLLTLYLAQKVESLLNADPRLVSRRDDDDRLPLHWAASYNRTNIVELLSEQRGFDVDAQDGAGWTALMMAASLKDGDGLVDLLLADGADVNEKTNNGQTALHFAASKSNLDTARKLISHKASARVKDKRGQLPLHRAAAVGSVPIIKLLSENKSPINATDIDGSTALHHAIAEGHGVAAQVLLKAGADNDKKDGNGALAIDLAPDAKVRSYILKAAEEDSVELTSSQ